MPSLLQPLPCNRDNKINLDGSYGLACLTGMVLINLDTFIFYVPLYVALLYKITLLCNRNMENHPGKQYNHKN
jgi:hypothetical protein